MERRVTSSATEKDEEDGGGTDRSEDVERRERLDHDVCGVGEDGMGVERDPEAEKRVRGRAPEDGEGGPDEVGICVRQSSSRFLTAFDPNAAERDTRIPRCRA